MTQTLCQLAARIAARRKSPQPNAPAVPGHFGRPRYFDLIRSARQASPPDSRSSSTGATDAGSLTVHVLTRAAPGGGGDADDSDSSRLLPRRRGARMLDATGKLVTSKVGPYRRPAPRETIPGSFLSAARPADSLTPGAAPLLAAGRGGRASCGRTKSSRRRSITRRS